MVLSILLTCVDLINFVINRWIKIEKKPFRLTDLPYLALNEVIRSMNCFDIISLASTSQKMENSVALSRIRMNIAIARLRNQSSSVSYHSKKIDIFCGDEHLTSGDFRYLTKTDMKRWCRYQDPYRNLWEVIERLRSIFVCPPVIMLFIHCDLMGSIDIENDTSIIKLIENAKEVFVVEGNISSKNLNLIMTHARPEIDFIMYARAPNDFDSENVFKFKNTVYNDANWLKAHHLCSARNRSGVEIMNENTLSNVDIQGGAQLPAQNFAGLWWSEKYVW